jgi:hypothetical protein
VGLLIVVSDPAEKGGQNRKNCESRSNAWSDCFALLVPRLGAHIRGFGTLPAPPHPFVPPREKRVHFHPSSALMHGRLVSLVLNCIQMLTRLVWLGEHPWNYICVHLDARAHPSLWGVQNRFWAFPKAFSFGE